MMIGIGLVRFAGINPPSGIGTVVAVVVAALFEGQHAARRNPRSFSKSEIWASAFAMTGVVAVINAVFLAGLYAVPWVSAILTRAPAQQIAVIFMVMTLIALIVNRLFLTTGFQAELRQITRGRRAPASARRSGRGL